MIPIKGKTYEIDFWDIKDHGNDYHGLGKYLGKGDLDENDNQLYIFELPNNTCHASFAEEDIINVRTE
jgi:hypothetical protein